VATEGVVSVSTPSTVISGKTGSVLSFEVVAVVSSGVVAVTTLSVTDASCWAAIACCNESIAPMSALSLAAFKRMRTAPVMPLPQA